ncbi:hypothetical protein M3Y96_00576200 [Aphelenchoides besseyi]|nr:hypothetical protein M3Y96_00576200 [Aphelenchoides besseyi]
MLGRMSAMKVKFLKDSDNSEDDSSNSTTTSNIELTSEDSDAINESNDEDFKYQQKEREKNQWVNVITMASTESEDEVVADQRKAPVVEQTSSQMISRIQSRVDVLPIKYFDGNLLHKVVLSPLVASSIVVSSLEISPTSLLLNEFIKVPRFVFYDQPQLSEKFNNLPNDWWLSEEKSGILFVQHEQLEWKGVEIGESFCRFLLSDNPGWVHCFCKPDCK